MTPLRDGMNLVVKEYLASQDPEDPGMPVLSCFAGAAHELAEAIIGQSVSTAKGWPRRSCKGSTCRSASAGSGGTR